MFDIIAAMPLINRKRRGTLILDNFRFIMFEKKSDGFASRVMICFDPKKM